MTRRALACWMAVAVIATFAPTVSSAAPPAVPTTPLPVITSALWMGDSIAYELSPGVVTALTAAGIEIASHAFPGISLTEDSWMPPGETWIYDHHEPMLAANDADVVIWELSLFDTLSARNVLMLGHTAFVDVALRNHQAVVFVVPPPLADGAVPYSPGWATVTDVAFTVAATYPGRVFVADSAALWGTSFVGAAPDGTPLRKPDGVHICPLGAALFGDFLARWLADHFAGVNPTDTAMWPLDWWSDERYDAPPGSCDPH